MRDEPDAVAATEPAVTRRGTLVAAAAAFVGGAAAVRFLATPSDGAAGTGAADTPQRLVVQLVPLGRAAAERALSQLADASHRIALIEALQDRRLHLVEAPFVGIGDGIGRLLSVASGGILRTIILAAAPQSVLLPIWRFGQITVEAAGLPAHAALLTMSGPLELADLRPGAPVLIDVIVQ